MGGGNSGKDLTMKGRILRGESRWLSKVLRSKQEGDELMMKGRVEETDMHMFLLKEAMW